jgi:hypothetical protein
VIAKLKTDKRHRISQLVAGKFGSTAQIADTKRLLLICRQDIVNLAVKLIYIQYFGYGGTHLSFGDSTVEERLAATFTNIRSV